MVARHCMLAGMLAERQSYRSQILVVRTPHWRSLECGVINSHVGSILSDLAFDRHHLTP